MPQPPPRLGALPGAAQGCFRLEQVEPQSLKLVCSPVFLKLSPCPPMYAWSVNQARASAIDKPVFGSFTWTFEISDVLRKVRGGLKRQT